MVRIKTYACNLLLALMLTFTIQGYFQSNAYAQTVTATLTGRVIDSNGRALQNVKIVAINQGTKLEYSTQTTDSNIYTIPFLPVGNYIISIEATGFKKLISNPINLDVNQIAKIDVTLQVGEISEEVVVNDIFPILQTESVTVSQVITGSTISSLPLNGRNFQQLTLLIPGTITPDINSFTFAGQEGQGRPFVNGNREQGNTFLLDGISLDETIDNRIGYKPNVDAISEFKIETSNSSAEFGNVTGATVSLSLKSGTNEFRGNLFEFIRNDALDANSWNNNRVGAPKQKLRQNILGGTLGGPIVKNKLFFFGDYQGIFARTGGGAATTVAPLEWRNGDLSSIDFPIIDPITGKPFPGNIIPQNRIVNPVALKLFANNSIYPLPTRAGATDIDGNFVTTTSEKLNNHQFDIRIDARLTDKDNFSGRYSFGNSNFLGNKGLLPTNATLKNFSRPQNIALSWIHTFNSSIINEARVGFNRAVFISSPFDWANIGKLNKSVGIPGSQAIDGLSFIFVSFSGISDIGTLGIIEDNVNNTFQYSNNLTINKGRHSVKLGGQFLRYQQNRFFSGNNGALGFFSYTGTFTGFAFSDFLLDQVDEKGLGIKSFTFGHRQNRIGLFVQDDFKAKNNLTLNLGLRWEYTSPLVEVKDRQSNFDITTGEQLFAGQNGNSRALYKPHKKGFEPRVGLAWTPNILNNKLVLRAGYGITQYMEGTGSNLRLPFNVPFFAEGDVIFDTSTGPGTVKNGFADLIVLDKPAGLIRIYETNVRPQFTQQWNLTFEYQLDKTTSLSAAYVGHKATHLIAPTDFNQPLPDPGPPSTWRPLQQRRPLFNVLPQVTRISGTESWSVSNYHALQLNANRRFSKGLEFTASYTFSKALTDNLGYFGSAGVASQGAYASNAYNRRADYGPAFFDATHNFIFSGTYELPFGKNKLFGNNWASVLNGVLGGWSVSNIISAHSGFPITIAANDVSLQDPRGGGRPNRIANGKSSNQSINNYLDKNAFTMPELGTFGNSGVGILRAPGYANWDFAAEKRFNLTESKYLNFRAEFFNFTNHPSFGPPNSFFNSQNFGKITSTVSSPRILEFALKFYF